MQSPKRAGEKYGLNKVCQNPKYKRKFPQSLRKDIFGLIKEFSLFKVCSHLNLDQGYVLKKLGAQSPLIKPKELNFQEVLILPQQEEKVIIELFHSDLRARIEGPISCVRRIYLGRNNAFFSPTTRIFVDVDFQKRH